MRPPTRIDRAPVRMVTAGLTVLTLLTALALLSGCVQIGADRIGAAGADPAVVGARGPAAVPSSPAPSTAATAAPEPAMAATAAVQDFWRAAFPAAFGRPWRDIRNLTAVPTRSRSAPKPPCVGRAAEVAGQAFYCPAADAVVWDADGLLPRIGRTFGTAGVVVLLAHEIGHAVQSRLGVDRSAAADPARYPTILVEAMADCYAGVTMAELVRRPVAGLAFGPQDRDTALRALVGFRDPVGLGASDASAHGNAFDRVSAFQDGWTGGATRCARMTVAERAFTEQRFGSAADQARRGDLPLSRLLPAVTTDARSWFTASAVDRAPGWRAPAPTTAAACPPAQLAAQGPAGFCPVDGSVTVDRPALAAVADRSGDFAAAELVAGRYALATVGARGGRTDSTAAGRTATCLTGAYTAYLSRSTGAFALSPGDLDEAVQELLAADRAARDDRGRADPGDDGFDRVARFRSGVRGGAAACLTG